ncbi:unnamed protein product [marine sediment metagenome]|uniref:DUF7352 domain-containing protein n=1 Tax=marine sediment metagenome TaxID=412755 RepID=X0Y9L5_9ZZZZ
MKTIWKLEINFEDVQLVEMPHGSVPLKVGWDPHEKKAYLWVECDTRKDKMKCRVFVRDTGENLDGVAGYYIGTVTYPSRVEPKLFQWHIYFNPEPVV